MSLYDHVPHPRIHARKEHGPATVAHQRFAGKSTLGRIGALIGLKITLIVGTMTCATAFTALALISLPAAVKSASLIVIVAWVAQTFLQLVLLPVIIVGQNVQAKAADARSEQTFRDAEAILHECLELQKHLAAQDAKLVEALPPRRLRAAAKPKTPPAGDDPLKLAKPKTGRGA